MDSIYQSPFIDSAKWRHFLNLDSAKYKSAKYKSNEVWRRNIHRKWEIIFGAFMRKTVCFWFATF